MHHREDQPDTSRLVWVLQAQLQDGILCYRWLGTDAVAFDTAQTRQTQRTRPRERSSAVAEQILWRPWAVQSDSGPRAALRVPYGVNYQPESRVRENRTHGSERGGAG